MRNFIIILLTFTLASGIASCNKEDIESTIEHSPDITKQIAAHNRLNSFISNYIDENADQESIETRALSVGIRNVLYSCSAAIYMGYKEGDKTFGYSKARIVACQMGLRASMYAGRRSNMTIRIDNNKFNGIEPPMIFAKRYYAGTPVANNDFDYWGSFNNEQILFAENMRISFGLTESAMIGTFLSHIPSGYEADYQWIRNNSNNFLNLLNTLNNKFYSHGYTMTGAMDVLTEMYIVDETAASELAALEIDTIDSYLKGLHRLITTTSNVNSKVTEYANLTWFEVTSDPGFSPEFAKIMRGIIAMTHGNFACWK